MWILAPAIKWAKIFQTVRKEVKIETVIVSTLLAGQIKETNT